MDSIGSISSATAEALISPATPVTPTSVAQQTSAASAKAAEEDSVQLSAEARAESMYRLGQAETDIAHVLNTTTQVVDGYLGLTFKKELEHTLNPPLQA